MFEREVHDGGSFGFYALQQLGVVCFSIAWALCSVELPRWISGFGAIGRVFETLTIVTLGVTPAFVVGRLLANRNPSLAESGRWVWFLPTALLGVGFLYSIYGPRFGQGVLELLCPGHDGEEWWAVLFFTYPLLACCGYSLGMMRKLGTTAESGYGQ